MASETPDHRGSVRLSADVEDGREESTASEQAAPHVYAPPREDAPPVPAPPTVGPPPFGIRALTYLVLWVVNGSLAFGLMTLAARLAPGDDIMKFAMAHFSWLALTAFAIMGSLLMGAGIFGPHGKVTRSEKVSIVMAGVVAAVVCFLPLPSRIEVFGVRAVISLVSEGLTLLVSHRTLTIVQRRYGWRRDGTAEDGS